MLNDKIYKVLKWFLIIFVPALITLIGGLGKVYNFDTTTINLTIGIVATFLGTITGISNAKYYNQSNDNEIENHEVDK